MKKTWWVLCIALILSVGCSNDGGISETKEVIESESFPKYPYIPKDGVYMFIGQDLGAVGGLDDYTEGYVDYIGVPAGVTTYTNSYSLDGLMKMDNWGSGDVYGQLYVEDETFNDSMIAIGFHMVDDEEALANGTKDELIKELGGFIKRANRPVFLRIGYEFDGGHNHYDPEEYINAFRRIVDVLREEEVDNFVTVWQSAEIGSADHYMKWYPGDDYVDWLGYSYFNSRQESIGLGILEIAREKNKPVFIAEATPRRDMSRGQIDRDYDEWFNPFFEHVEANKDVIKAVSYINVRWMDQPMWEGGSWGDSRVFIEPVMTNHWIEEMNSGLWIHGPILDNPPEYVRKEHEQIKTGTGGLDVDYGEIIEGESGEMTGNVTTYEDMSASSGQGVAYIMEPGDKVIFDGPDEPVEVFAIRYASELEGTMTLYINDEIAQNFSYKTTGQWVGTYRLLEIEQVIQAGESVAIGFEEGDAAINIDFIKYGPVEE